MKRTLLRALLLLLAAPVFHPLAADGNPPASPEVTAAMQPYLDSHKLAGVIGSDHVLRFPEAGGGLFSTTHDILRYGLMPANDGELDGKRYLSPAAMEELRQEQTGATKVNYSLGYHLRNGMFGHDGAYGTDLSVNMATGMVAVSRVQCTSGDQWAARDLFLQTATQVFGWIAR